MIAADIPDWSREARDGRHPGSRLLAMIRAHQALAGRRGPVSRLLAVARELSSGGYLRYGSFPKTDLIADLRGR